MFCNSYHEENGSEEIKSHGISKGFGPLSRDSIHPSVMFSKYCHSSISARRFEGVCSLTYCLCHEVWSRYGRLYCVQVDRVALQLHMYRFYRDAVVPQVTYY